MAAPSERHEKTKEEINVSEKPCKKPDSRKRNMLEFEDIPPIKQRLKLNYKEKPNRLETTKVPQSSVLSRVKAFLPTLKADNEKVLSNSEEYQIESKEEADKYIEMNVALCEMNSNDENSEDDSVESSSQESSSDEEILLNKKIEEI